MKVLIIEDEAAAVRRLEKLLLELDETIQIVGKLDSIESSLQWLDQNTLPDIVFLDIHLADGSSFEILNHFNLNRPIIFTTAYDKYAIQAFKVNAIDYLLKPIKRQDLARALDKFKTQQKGDFDYQKLRETVSGNIKSKRFLIRIGQNLRVVDLKEVAYFYTENRITFLVTKKGKRYPLDNSLEKLEETIDAQSFFRINRQFIINIDAIQEMYAYSKSRVKIELNPTCALETIVSTERSPYFKKWLLGDR